MNHALLPLVLLGACGRPPAASVPVSPHAVDVPARVREARAIVRARSAESASAIDLASERVTQFFAPRFEAVDELVDELFGWRGKWRATFWGRAEYERWVRRAFERRLFGPADFEREVLAKARADFAYATAAAENRMLADVHALVRTDAPELRFDAFAAWYRDLADDLLPAVARDVGMNVVAIAGSEVVAVGAGMALAAMAAGLANSWWSFGVSLVAGLVAGIVIDAIVGGFAEDEARMRVHLELVRLRREAADAVVDAMAAAWRDLARRQEEAISLAVERSFE